MNYSKNLIFTALALFTLSGSVAQAHPARCYEDCWYDRWGHRHCRTVCHHDGHHHNPPPVVIIDPDKGDIAISAGISALSLTTSAIEDGELKELLVVQVSEDAAAYLENGRMTGLLPALLRLAREDAAKQVGAEQASEISETALVDGILSAAEAALEKKASR